MLEEIGSARGADFFHRRQGRTAYDYQIANRKLMFLEQLALLKQ